MDVGFSAWPRPEANGLKEGAVEITDASPGHSHPRTGRRDTQALVSLVTERTVRSDTAMTGEISLRCLVLPVGGIKEKVVGAHRAGIKRVMLPARNRKDFDDVPEEVRKQVEFVWLDRVEEAVSSALESPAIQHPAPLGLADAQP
jgi:ATP-dependent Lon protease